MEMAIFIPLFRWALTGTTLVLMAAVAAPAQAPSLAMLDRLEKGRWQLTERGTQNALHSLCLGDAQRMIQIRHPRSGCSRFVIEDKPNSVTVHRSEEHTSELQSLMRISYAVFCLKKTHKEDNNK